MFPRSLRLSHRFLSTVNSSTFKADNLRVTLCSPEKRKPKPDDPNTHKFGTLFTDHLLSIRWTLEKGWDDPEIIPFQNFSLHPATKTLHYSQNLFEGLKCYRGDDGKIRLFRPEKNMERMVTSAKRASLATFNPDELLKCLKKFIMVDADWVPSLPNTSLYIRPTFMGIEPTLGVNSADEALLFVIFSPVGAYFGTKIVPVSLLADPAWVRAWPGGAGSNKLASNYGPTLSIQKNAVNKGCHQVLWLFGDDEQLTEAGAMNIFAFLINDKGEKELITPPLEQGVILPGITRDSILTITRDWNQFKVTERKITMDEVIKTLEQGRLLEMFGAGTAAVVSPISRINYQDKDYLIPTMESKDAIAQKLLKTIMDIQYGRIEYKNWTQIVC
ncbi:branched-chain-amino-acid aminotransferase-like [Panonychus citri]|uniref:branched-chain-amino-acid aminotransferase-like n=1 Tax=Panonychus citri TaxID=50023 RepID=UPI002307D8A4|nr:branched-chain-amino-acid aminotransferase-like [Panonychus citri]